MFITTSGRVVRDAIVNTIDGGKQVVNFSLACSRSYRNKDGERKRMTTFYDCSYWRSSKVAEHLTKGTVIEMTGIVWADIFFKKDDKKKKNPQACLKFRINDFNFLASATESGSAGQKTAPVDHAHTGEPSPNDDLPF